MISAFLAAAGGGGVIVYGAIRARADWISASSTKEAEDRAEVREIIGIKDEMIAALKAANEELREGARRSVAREDTWRREREELKGRLDAVEDSFRAVVVAVVNAGICAKAPGCVDYVAPADRRDNGAGRSVSQS